MDSSLDSHVAGLHEGTSAGLHDWEQQKETIHGLYIRENYTLQRLIEDMKAVHGFSATYATHQ